MSAHPAWRGRARGVFAAAIVALVALLLAVQAQSAPPPPLALASPATVDGANQLWAVSCPSTSLCVATDSAGEILTSTDPAAGTWSAPIDVDGTTPIYGVSCPSTSLCVAVDGNGAVISSTNPTAAASSWSQPAAIDSDGALVGISCPTISLCVAVDDAGDIVTSTDPGAGAAAWSPPVEIDASSPLDGISCASNALCVAIDALGNIVTITNPTAGASAWSTPADVDSDIPLNAVSCTATFCAAADDFGNVLESSITGAGPGPWTVTNIDPGGSLEAISCTGQYCETVDDTGNMFEKAPAPWGAATDGWGLLGTVPQPLYGTSCPSAGLCANVGELGVALAATGDNLSLTISGSGNVSDANAQLNCSADCSVWYPAGANATLQATPTSGSSFEGWGGGCPGTSAASTCSVAINANETASASFAALRGGQGSNAGSGSRQAGGSHAGTAGVRILGMNVNQRRDSATFRFTANGDRVSFQCALVSIPTRLGARPARVYRRCQSPRTYRHLARGRYRFYVRPAPHNMSTVRASRRTLKVD